MPSSPTPPPTPSPGWSSRCWLPPRPAGAEPSPPVPGLYQIRCWQHGRLLFEDRITLPDDAAAYSIRLSGNDRSGKPMYVAETRTATCLIRQAPPPASY